LLLNNSKPPLLLLDFYIFAMFSLGIALYVVVLNKYCEFFYRLLIYDSAFRYRNVWVGLKPVRIAHNLRETGNIEISLMMQYVKSGDFSGSTDH
jgi:hypothetical protein